MKIIRLTSALLIATCISVSHAAVIHVTDLSGNLLGAKNVSVAGTFYDVAFLDGTCVALYDRCNEADDFIFNSLEAANMASQALLDTVFVDSLNQRFDYTPELTNGCNSVQWCFVLTPWATINIFGGRNSVITSAAQNKAEEAADVITDIRPETLYDTADTSIFNYAVWSAATQVPGPRVSILLSLGLVGIFWSRKRKKL